MTVFFTCDLSSNNTDRLASNARISEARDVTEAIFMMQKQFPDDRVIGVKPMDFEEGRITSAEYPSEILGPVLESIV